MLLQWSMSGVKLMFYGPAGAIFETSDTHVTLSPGWLFSNQLRIVALSMTSHFHQQQCNLG